MALWKDQSPAKPAGNPPSPEPARFQPETMAPPTAPAPVAATPAPAAAPAPAAKPARQVSESIIAADLTIEKGAKLTGGVRAAKITIAGELEGNVDFAQRVDLLDSGVLNGDLKANQFTVAAGSRMRGSVEFGGDDKSGRKSGNDA